jgi:hypothetical protein
VNITRHPTGNISNMGVPVTKTHDSFFSSTCLPLRCNAAGVYRVWRSNIMKDKSSPALTVAATLSQKEGVE